MAMTGGRATLCLGIVVGVGCVVGCPSPPSETPSNEPSIVRAAVTLHVAVVGDDRLAGAIDRLRGEWSERTDGTIEVVRSDSDAGAASDGADLIVFASRRLGELCEAGKLRPVRQSVLDDESLAFDDLLPLVREQEIVYGQRVMALPLGCPTPLRLDVSVTDDTGTASLEAQAEQSDEQLALGFLAWAAPHAVHRSRLATLFDADDFRPRLATPPFVRALRGHVEASPVERSFVWPRREEGEPLPAGATPAAPPTAEESFNSLAGRWEPIAGDGGHATLLASSGRLVAVTSASRNAASAFRLAAWLAGPDNARLLSSASDGVANCRGSFARSADAWLPGLDRSQARAFAAEAADALRRRRFLITPRLPGADRYLDTLGAAVRDALGGEDPEAVLRRAADAWEAISEELGRDRQAAAYARSVNADSWRD